MPMRAAVVETPASPPVCADVPSPPGDPWRLVGAGVHPAVRGMASGRLYAAKFPMIAGIDAVARTPDGRLVYAGPMPGSMAELLVSPYGVDVPDGADPLAIAAGVNPGISSRLVLDGRTLHTVLVLGATGIAGSMAVQTAFALGATRVVAVGRDSEALDRVRGFGAVTVPLPSLGEALADSASTVVLDYVWGAVAEEAFTALGTVDAGEVDYVQIGSAAGDRAALPAMPLRARRLRLTGSGAGTIPREKMAAAIPAVMAAIADGTLDVPYTAYPLGAIAEAWSHQARTRAVVVPD